MKQKKFKKQDLGKGIRALLDNMDNNPDTTPEQSTVQELTNTVANIPIEAIEVNPYQPRYDFDEEALQELSESIKVHGLIQPLTVRHMGQGKYQLISGERRMRASTLANLTEVPAYVRLANDQEMLEMALVENIQRENLNAMEVAITYQRLKEECQLTDETLSERVGKKRSSVTNYLRLLKLPPDVQSAIKNKDISMGHARALAGVDDTGLQLTLLKQVLDQGLSVRAIEDLIRSYSEERKPKSKKGANQLPDDYQFVQNHLCKQLDAKVTLKRKSNGKGQIIIPFGSDKDLNRLLELMSMDNM